MNLSCYKLETAKTLTMYGVRFAALLFTVRTETHRVTFAVLCNNNASDDPKCEHSVLLSGKIGDLDSSPEIPI